MPILTGFGPNPRGPKSGQVKLADLDALVVYVHIRVHHDLGYTVSLNVELPLVLDPPISY